MTKLFSSFFFGWLISCGYNYKSQNTKKLELRSIINYLTLSDDE